MFCYLSFLTNACFRLGALPRLEFPFVHSAVFVFVFFQVESGWADEWEGFE